MRIALVHDWLVTYAGAERVTEQMLLLYPGADLFSLVDFLPDADRGFIQGKHATTTWVQKLPLAEKRFRAYLPFFPWAIERLNLKEYDLILSSSHAVAKGVRTRVGQTHLCYCHTPMRYAWDMRDEYLAGGGLKALRRWIAGPALSRLREWDRRTAARVSAFAANSHFIADRIRSSYGRESTVIHPPVAVDRFAIGHDREPGLYVHISRLVPYKRADLVIEAFRGLAGRRLVVVGEGSCLEQLRLSAPENVELPGRLSDDDVRSLLSRAQAMVFAGVEDFGIVLVEAMSCGTPVLALGKGGARDSVVHGETGILFKTASPGAIRDAIRQAEAVQWDREIIRRHAERFRPERFRNEFSAWVEQHVSEARTSTKM